MSLFREFNNMLLFYGNIVCLMYFPSHQTVVINSLVVRIWRNLIKMIPRASSMHLFLLPLLILVLKDHSISEEHRDMSEILGIHVITIITKSKHDWCSRNPRAGKADTGGLGPCCSGWLQELLVQWTILSQTIQWRAIKEDTMACTCTHTDVSTYTRTHTKTWAGITPPRRARSERVRQEQEEKKSSRYI